MTDVLPDSETNTTNLAVARLRAQEWPPHEPRVYNAQRLRAEDTLIMRPGEGPIIITGEITTLTEDLLDYTTAPPIPPRPSPTPPPKPTNGRPIFYQGQRRRPLPRWAVAIAIVGLVLGAWTWGWMSHALVIGALR